LSVYLEERFGKDGFAMLVDEGCRFTRIACSLTMILKNDISQISATIRNNLFVSWGRGKGLYKYSHAGYNTGWSLKYSTTPYRERFMIYSVGIQVT
jgi:hypothetical protein